MRFGTSMSAHHILGLEKTIPIISGITSLPFRNKRVINKLKTEEAIQVANSIFSRYARGMVGSVGKGCSEVDRAYIAGLIDCDGAIMALIESHKEKRFGFRVRVIIKLTQKNPALLQWIHTVLGIGSIRKNRTTFDWILRDQQHCGDVLNLIQTYSRGKQRQVELALQILQTPVCSELDLLTKARLADTLSGFNV